MRSRLLPLTILALLFSRAALAVDVRLCTDRGAIDVAIDEQLAPLQAANFLGYVDSGFYSGTVLHRVVRGSMVQGGSFDRELERRPAGAPVANESGNGLANRRGTIAASRSGDPSSATSQFFFNLADNTHLDTRPGSPGYTVFGRVTAGLELLDAISALPTRRVGELEDVPQPLVEIRTAVRLEQAPVFGLSIESDPARLAAGVEAARARGDAAGTLRAVDGLRRACVTLDASQHLAEAEAAVSLGRIDRARRALERYMDTASAIDPGRTRAEQLYAILTGPDRSRDAGELIGHCRRPVSPTVPDSRFTDRATLIAAESAVRRYRQLGEIYLDCVSERIGRDDLDESETRDLTRLHNEMVFELTGVLTRFNRAVREFSILRGLQRSPASVSSDSDQ